LAELYRLEFGIETDFIPGQGGILEVKHDDIVIWSNRNEQRDKPTNAEAREALQNFLKQQ